MSFPFRAYQVCSSNHVHRSFRTQGNERDQIINQIIVKKHRLNMEGITLIYQNDYFYSRYGS